MQAWEQAFGLLASFCPCAASQVVRDGARSAKDAAELEQWAQIADCLNAIYLNEAMQ